MLVWACLACTSHGRRLQSLAEAHPPQQQARGLEAIAALLSTVDPVAGFSGPGHGYNRPLSHHAFRNSKAVESMRHSKPDVFMEERITRKPEIFIDVPVDFVNTSDVGTPAAQEFDTAGPLAPHQEKYARWRRNLAEKLQASVAALTSRKAWMACAIGICADLSAQMIAGARTVPDFVPRQTFAMAVWSLCYTGAFRKVVDKQFDRWCGKGTSNREVFSKQFVELFLFKPICHVPALYMATGVMAGKGWAASWIKLCSVYKTTMLFSWALWPLPLYVYFRYVPYSLRVLYYSVFAFIQKCGFSYLSLPGNR